MKVTKTNWKYYQETLQITTDALWISTNRFPKNKPIFLIPNRSYLPPPDKDFHGVWIAEIPYQFILRFTEKEDTVWSVFGGSGVDYEVATYCNRKCIITDLTPRRDYIIQADARHVKFEEKFKLILLHPPYWDIIKYSDRPEDGSTKKTLSSFLEWWDEIVFNVTLHLKQDGFLVLAAGNIYKNSEEIELGELLKNVILLNYPYVLKSHIIKDYGETKGNSARYYNVNYYRQLRGNYNNFYGDNIYLFQKKQSLNKLRSMYNKILSFSPLRGTL